VPELPDITIYVESLTSRILNSQLQSIKVINPFLLRSVDPPIPECIGKRVIDIERLGKRIVLCLEDEYFLVIHLMIAGRLQWKTESVKPPRKYGLALFSFDSGHLLLTEAGTKRRASLHAVRFRDSLSSFNPGGLEVLDAVCDEFQEALRKENHTVKRSLTDPRIFSGIGNAYSDEILHAAKMSPFKQTRHLSDDECKVLYDAAIYVLTLWIDRFRTEVGDGFPKKVTAFRKEMAVHGKYGRPCPECDTPIQRIRYAENEANYCPTCQTGGKLLADRALSKLLKGDWPSTLDELEELKRKSSS